MTVTASVLIPSKDASATVSSEYTSTNVTTIIDKFTAINHSVAAASITVYLATAGDTNDSTNVITKTKTLQVNESYTFPEIVGHVLASGSKIYVQASAADSISIRSSGRLVT